MILNFYKNKYRINLAWLNRYSYFVMVVFLLSSCNVYKHLDADEKLVNQHKIIFDESEADIDDVDNLKYDLKNIARPRPNRKALGLFRNRLSAYFRTEADQDYGWYKTWLKQKIAEPPALYDSLDVTTSAKRMTNHLHDLGYWNTRVKTSVKLKKHTANISYNILLNRPYEINHTRLFSKDRTIDSLLQMTSPQQILKKGARLSNDNYQKEVERIGKLLRNNGYAAFLPSIYVDKIRGDTLGDYSLEVFLYEDSLAHPQYDIGQIHVYLDDIDTRTTFDQSDTLNHIIYHYNGDEPYLKRKLLDKKIEFRPDESYSKKKIDDTRVLLGGITALNRINISNHVRDSSEIIDFDIRLQRNLRYGWNTDLTTGYTVVSNENRNRIGFSGAFGFTDRNTFRGGEVFNTQIRGGLEFDFLSDVRNGLITTDLQFNNSLKIPTFRDVYRTYSSLYRLGFFKGFIDEMRKKGTTNIRANIRFLNFTDFYSYQNFEIDLGHSVQYKQTKFNITQTGFNYWNPKTTDRFRTTNMDNQNLLRSFEPRLLTGLIFRRLDMTYISKRSPRGGQFTFLGNIDASGHEVYVANLAYRWAANNEDVFNVGTVNGENLNFAQYFKFELDGRYSRKLGLESSLTGRANFGLAIPYGFDTINIVPYVAQFSVGGPYSIRGWEARELGPGGSATTIDNPISFAQKGDLKIEINLEYRQRLIWYLHGAVFADAGNVWTLNKQDAEPDEVFGSTFLDQFALGAGYGFRFDYDGLFVIRLDMGYKFRQPFDDPGSGHWIHDQIKLADANFNFAVGYPF